MSRGRRPVGPLNQEAASPLQLGGIMVGCASLVSVVLGGLFMVMGGS